MRQKRTTSHDLIVEILVDKTTNSAYRYFCNRTGIIKTGKLKFGFDDGPWAGDEFIEPQCITGVIDNQNQRFILGYNQIPVLVNAGKVIVYDKSFIDGKTTISSYSVFERKIIDTMVIQTPFVIIKHLEYKFFTISEDQELSFSISIFNENLEKQKTIIPFPNGGFDSYGFVLEDNDIYFSAITPDKKIKYLVLNKRFESVLDKEIFDVKNFAETYGVLRIFPSDNGILLQCVLFKDGTRHLIKCNLNGEILWQKNIILPNIHDDQRSVVQSLRNQRIILFCYIKSEQNYFLKVLDSNNGTDIANFNFNQIVNASTTKEITRIRPDFFNQIAPNKVVLSFTGYDENKKPILSCSMLFNFFENKFDFFQSDKSIYKFPIVSYGIDNKIIISTKTINFNYENK